jgi:hypothetical protein
MTRFLPESLIEGPLEATPAVKRSAVTPRRGAVDSTVPIAQCSKVGRSLGYTGGDAGIATEVATDPLLSYQIDGATASCFL